MQPIVIQDALRMAQLFSFGRCVGFYFFWILVFHKFPVVPSYVPQVLNAFPRHAPNSTTLYSIICAQSWTSITYKGGPKGITSRLIFWECPMLQKEMWWANQSDSLGGGGGGHLPTHPQTKLLQRTIGTTYRHVVPMVVCHPQWTNWTKKQA
jgi:hypothetical protein